MGNESETTESFVGKVVPIVKCEKFLDDPRFETAKESLAIPIQGHDWPNVLLELRCSEKLQEIATDCCLDRVYFHKNRFEVIVDCRGYSMSDLICKVNLNMLLLTAYNKCFVKTPAGITTLRTVVMERKYDLPKKIKVEGTCLLSSDGILAVSFPWEEEKHESLSSSA